MGGDSPLTRHCSLDHKRPCEDATSMTRSPAQVNRFFVSTDFSVSYRRGKQIQWQSQATSGYALLVMLNGEVSYALDSKTLQLNAAQFVLFEPNATITIDAQRAELLFLTFS